MRRKPNRYSLSTGLACLLAIGLLTSCVCASEPLVFVETGGYGTVTTFQVGLGDLDADGDLDAVFANQGRTPSRVLLNDGTGTFTYTDDLLTTQGHGVGIGDVDLDGDLDAVIVSSAYRMVPKATSIYFNDGTGHFQTSDQVIDGRPLSSNTVQLFDIDGDGDLDLFVAYIDISTNEFLSHVYLNDGRGVFTRSDHDFPFGTHFHDLDGDGDMDAFTKVSGTGYTILSNDGDGKFELAWELVDPSVEYALNGMDFADLDNDGLLDIIDTNGTWNVRGSIRLFFGTGNGQFEEAPTDLPDAQATWPAFADFNGDGLVDIVLSMIAEDNQVWLNRGNRVFADSGVRLGGQDSRGLAVGDLDGDGDLDLFIPVYGMIGGPNVVWLNQSN